MNKDFIDNLIEDWERDRPDLNSQSMHVVGRLLKIAKHLEKKTGSALSGTGIHYPDLKLIVTLKRSGYPYELSPTELLKSISLTSGAMSALLERAAKQNLIYRTTDPKDGRVKKARLTEEGLRKFDLALEVRLKESEDTVKVLTVEEQKQLVLLLKKLMNSLM